MSDIFPLRVAKEGIKAAIFECSECLDESPPRALELLTECAETIAESLPNKPRMLGHVLGEYLTEAARLGKPDAVMCLKDNGASADYRNSEGFTPLQAAVTDGQCNMIRILASAGADLDATYTGSRHSGTAVHLAVARENPKSLGVLLAEGADPDSFDVKTLETGLHRVATRVAPQHGSADERKKHADMTLLLTKVLIDGGADPVVFDGSGFLPLHRAIRHSSSKEASILLLSAAKYEQHILDDALLMAIQRNQTSVIEAAVAAGADILCEREGKTVLELSASHANQETAQLVRSLITQATVQKSITDNEGNATEMPAVRRSLAPL